MSQKNIEIFKAISALAYAELYDHFPRKTVIEPSKLALALGDEYWDESQLKISENVSEYVRHKSPAGIAKPTIEWLAESGFIKYERYSDQGFLDVVLTAKGLEAIEAQENGASNLLSAAADLAKDELKNQARKKLSDIFSEILSWGIKHSPNVVQIIQSSAQ